MKRSKRMIVLSAILLVVCIAAVAATRYEEKQEEIRTSDDIILEIPSDEVESLSWEYTSEGLAFHKTDGVWLYDEDDAFPVSADRITEILSHFEAFGVSFIIENVEDYGQYGLDAPQCSIHLGTAERTYDIRLGDFSKMDEQRYVDIGDGNVYLVKDDPMDYLKSALADMIENDRTPAFENVSDITFTGSENYTITMTENSPDTYNADDIYFAEQDGETLPLDTSRVTEYLNTITSLSLSTYVTYNATDEELASFGLDEPELTVIVHYSYTDEDENEISDTFVMHIGQNAEELEAYKAAEEAEEELPDVTKYVRIGDSPIVYKLSDLDYVTLSAAGCNDLRHHEIFWADFDTVTQMDIMLEEENHSLTTTIGQEEPSDDEGDEDTASESETGEDDDRVWYYSETEIDISDLQRALTGLSADRFTDEEPDGKEEISLMLYLENENFPYVKLEFYRYDGSLCLAVADGKPVALVDRSDVMELVESVQAIVLN